MTTESIIIELQAKVDQYNKNVNSAASNTTAAQKQIETSVTRTASAVNRATNGMGRDLGMVSRSAGQAGIQFQQLIGQIQGGQSVMLAVSQQVADLGIVLGAPLAGAIAGISSSIAGLLLPQLFNAKTALEAMSEAAEKLDKVLDTTDEGIISLSQELLNLNNISEELARTQIAKGIIDAEESIKTAVDGIGDTLDDLPQGFTEFSQSLVDAFEESGMSLEDFQKSLEDFSFEGSAKAFTEGRDAIRLLGKEFDLTQEQATRLALAIGQFEDDANATTAQRLSTTLEDLGSETNNSNKNLVEFTSSLIPYIQGMNVAVDRTNALIAAQSNITEGPIVSPVGTSPISGETLTQTQESDNSQMAADIARFQAEQEGEAELEARQQAAETINEFQRQALNERLQISQGFADAEMDAQRARLLEGEELERESQQKLLADYENFYKNKEELSERSERAIISAEMQSARIRSSLAADVTSTILNSNLSGSEKIFEIIKDTAASSIQAFGAMAAARALAELPYPGNLVEAGRVTAWSGAAASVVRSLSLGGGGGNSVGNVGSSTTSDTGSSTTTTSTGTTSVSTTFGSATSEAQQTTIVLKLADDRTLGEVVTEQQAELQKQGIIP